MKKHLTVFCLLLTLCLLLAGCTGGTGSSAPASSRSAGVSSAGEPAAPSSQPEESSALPSSSAVSEAAPAASSLESSAAVSEVGTSFPGDSVYIGTVSGGFTAYPSGLEEGQVTPEALIARIAALTGWDLTLAETVATGKGGMSVCLAESSSLYVGPPEPQKDEFHMFSAEQMAETALDSIQKTLQEGFTLEGGDPQNIPIYFYQEGDGALTLSNIGLTWPLEEPYSWAGAQPIE